MVGGDQHGGGQERGQRHPVRVRAHHHRHQRRQRPARARRQHPWPLPPQPVGGPRDLPVCVCVSRYTAYMCVFLYTHTGGRTSGSACVWVHI